MTELNHRVLLGPENSAGRYFYAERVKFGAVRVQRKGRFPLSTVEVDECHIGIHSVDSPPAVVVETDDTVEAIETGLQQIYDNFSAIIERRT